MLKLIANIKLVVTIIPVLGSLLVYPQNKTIDSLEKVLQTQKQDTNRVNTLNKLSDQIIGYDSKNAFQQINEALILSKKIAFKKGEANAYKNLGRFFRSEGDYKKAIAEYLKAAQLNQQINNKEAVAGSYFNVGYNYSLIDNYPLAFRYFFLSLKISEEIKDSVNIIRTLIEIGRNYMYQGDFVNERKEYEIALKYITKLLFDQNFVELNLDVSHAMYRLGNYQKAFEWSQAAMKIHKKSGNIKGLAHDHTQLAYIYDKWGDSMSVLNNAELAEKYYANASINYQEAEKNFYVHDSSTTIGRGNISAINAELGDFYIKIGHLAKAQFCLNKSLRYSQELNWWDNLEASYYGLYRLDSARGNFKQAFKYYKLFVLYRDSITNKENLAKAEGSRLQYEFDKKEAAVKAIQDKKDALTVAEIKNQKLIRNFSLSGAFLIVSFGGYSFYRYRRRRKLQSQQEMLNERLRISRELHDDIGSTLGSISIYSEVAKTRSQKNQNADEAILKIGIASRELIEKMSDIVWSINPNNESFEQLQNRMQAFAAMILTPCNIHHSFIVDEEIKKVKLTAGERKNIFLIFKEAIHNIVKYAACEKVEIKLSLENNRFEMRIKDDGKGFDICKLEQESDSLGGNGIKNMRVRAGDIDASLNVESGMNKGTNIQVVILFN